jgi:hypothetical protein
MPAILPRSPQLCEIGGLSVLSSIRETEKSRVDGGRQSCCFWSKIPWRNRNCEMVCCCNATASSFVAKVQDEVFVHFHAITIKRHSSMQN